MAKDAALRITKVRAELMTEPGHLRMIEPSVRGGITLVFETRYFKAKNRYLPVFKHEEQSTFGFNIDANNLYGSVMLGEFFPIGNFRFADEVSISEILNMPINSTIGYFIELDLEFPASIHDQHKDYPFAPVKEIELDSLLSEFQIDKKAVQCTPGKGFQIAEDNVWQEALCFALQITTAICSTWNAHYWAATRATIQSRVIAGTLHYS